MYTKIFFNEEYLLIGPLININSSTSEEKSPYVFFIFHNFSLTVTIKHHLICISLSFRTTTDRRDMAASQPRQHGEKGKLH